MRLNTRLFLNVLDGINDKQAKKRLNKMTNNIGFIAIHLSDARFYWCDYLGVKVKYPFEEELKSIKSIEEIIRL